MALYNLTNLTASNHTVDWLQFIQLDVGVPIAEWILVATFLISFLALKRYDNTKALMGAVWITMLFALALFWMGLLYVGYVKMAVAAVVAVVALSYLAYSSSSVV